MNKKEYKTQEEKIRILKERRLNFLDEEEFKKTLDKYGYQTLVNGYNDFLFINNRSLDYSPNANEQNLISLFLFDREISSLLFKSITNIEMQIKNNIAEEICVFCKNELDDYDDNEIKYGQILKLKDSDLKAIFSNAFGKNSIFLFDYNNSNKNKKMNEFSKEKLRNLLEQFIPSNYNFKLLEKYKNNTNEIPIWTLSVFFSFGNAVKLLRALNHKIQSKIVSKFSNLQIGVKIFIEILEVFKNLRNRICHENVVYDSDFKLNLNRYQKKTTFLRKTI